MFSLDSFTLSASSLLALSTIATQCLAVVTTGGTGGVQNRLEVRTLQGNANAWNVYLLALSSMQNVSQSDVQSYYQISGIHGYPPTAYDGVTGVSNPDYSGYCTHRAEYFPSWHRAYVALFEQTLQQHAISEVNKFPAGTTKNNYLTAANSLRSPYLDWTQSTGGSAFPSFLMTPTVQVTQAVGGKAVKTTIPNPLYAYRFNPNPGDMGGSPYDNWPVTLRSPTSSTATNAQSQEGVSQSAVDADRQQLQNRVYKVLTNYTKYSQVSNEAWITQSPDTQDSFESIHDNFHVDVGGDNGGHMYYFSTSAFDPSFWLHHTEMDRLVALWQALHPSNWFATQTVSSGTFWYNSGQTIRATDGLKPFHQTSAGAFWTTNGVRDWTVFNYTYPELPSGYTQSSVRSAVDSLYGNTASPVQAVAKPASTTPPGSASRIRRFADTLSKRGDVTNHYEYYINIRADKNALLKAYTIYAFLGDAGEPSSWRSNPNLVGYQGVTGQSLTAEKAKALGPALVAGNIPLNRILHQKIASGELKHTTVDDINAYLKENLSWQVRASDGKVYDAKDVPNLLVSVGQTGWTPSTSSNDVVAEAVAEAQADTKNAWTSVVSDITEGKAGGLSASDVHLYKSD